MTNTSWDTLSWDSDGVIGVADNFQFRSRFNRPLT